MKFLSRKHVHINFYIRRHKVSRESKVIMCVNLCEFSISRKFIFFFEWKWKEKFYIVDCEEIWQVSEISTHNISWKTFIVVPSLFKMFTLLIAVTRKSRTRNVQCKYSLHFLKFLFLAFMFSQFPVWFAKINAHKFIKDGSFVKICITK